MPAQDMAAEMKMVRGVSADVISGAVNGPAIDTAGFDEALIILDVGTIAATGTLAVKVQEDTASAFGSPTDIAGAAFTSKVTGDSNTVFVGRVQLEVGREQFIRIVATQATAAVDAGVIVVLTNPVQQPAQTPEFAV